MRTISRNQAASALFALIALGMTTAARAAAGDAWLGLQVRDLPGGCIVSNILPGPLGGTGIESPTLCRPDCLESIDGQPASAAALARVLAAKSEGDHIELIYRPAGTRSWRIPVAVDRSNPAVTVSIQLKDKIAFTGTLMLPFRATDPAQVVPSVAADPLAWQSIALEAVAAAKMDGPLRLLTATLAAKSTATPDGLEPFVVRACAQSPLATADIARWIREPNDSCATRPQHTAATLVARCLGTAPPELGSQGSLPFNGPMSPVFVMDFLLNGAREFFQDLRVSPTTDLSLVETVQSLAAIATEGLAANPDQVEAACAALRFSATIPPEVFVHALKHIDVLVQPEIDYAKMEAIMPLPDELAGAVEGAVIIAEQIDQLGWVVVGTGEDNRYDMSRIAAVFDPGGNDSYQWSDPWIGNQGIIDIAGNDRYWGGRSQGPAGALLGLSFIDDHAGNDEYSANCFGCGAALLGSALLLDRAGDDRYESQSWSMGAAFVGAGVLIDLAGNDTYRGGVFCQGAGGPGGVGALIDAAGNDTYSAGPFASSVHGTAGAWASFGQGSGFGIRHYAAGGVGILDDLSGDDLYVAGEHAQGAGYFRALGILHDGSGRDRYNGDHYAQGTGVHQASGVLLDDGGDDCYQAALSAAQGCAWDLGIGVLVDQSGNDQYRGDILAQGSAAQQAMGMLIDLTGDDHFLAAGMPAQGESGTNEYHFGSTGALSFSLIVNMGGGSDFFSSGRKNGTTQPTGTANAESP
ncbi:MAG: hypothetical protein EXS00_04410, partial [Phycisphaerales bacterium]|nr:hypothetical protein [Phycisphaerales bacterium]